MLKKRHRQRIQNLQKQQKLQQMLPDLPRIQMAHQQKLLEQGVLHQEQHQQLYQNNQQQPYQRQL